VKFQELELTLGLGPFNLSLPVQPILKT